MALSFTDIGKDLCVLVISHIFARLFRLDTGGLPNVREDVLKIVSGIPIYYHDILTKNVIASL
jgi:hypothetical protein